MGIAAFLSYSHRNKKVAAQIMAALEKYGFDVFLAHEHIRVSADWEKEILRQLQLCDVFIALLTRAFDTSDWTHQEIGIAYAKGCVMVPVKARENPVGFMAKYQGIRLNRDNIEQTVWKVVQSITTQSRRLGREIRWALIRQVENAPSYIDAGWVLGKLADIDGLKATEVETVLQLASSNDQVYGAYLASRPLRELINKHKAHIREPILKTFLGAWAYNL